MLKFVGVSGMALQVPFVRWDYERHPLHLSPNGIRFYYAYTAEGAREIVAQPIHRGCDRRAPKQNAASIL